MENYGGEGKESRAAEQIACKKQLAVEDVLARFMSQIITVVAKFVFMMVVMTIFCTFIWDICLNGRVYCCTDGGAFDYWNPGDWVHAHDGSPVVVVDKIVAPHDMSDPDSIKSGWSEERLWDTWLAFLAGSVAVSIWLACLKWTKILALPGPLHWSDAS